MRSTFTSLIENVDYTIEIHDSSFSSSITDFKVTQDGFVLQYDGESEERYNPIITSSLTIKMIVENATHEAFIDDLVTAAEQRFRVRVERGPTNSVYWVGLILTDLVTIEDLPYPYTFEIKATDGIGKLKNIDYNNGGTPYTDSTEYDTIYEHIDKCLKKIGTSDLWTASEKWQAFSIDWWEDDLTRSNSTNVFQITRVHHKAFIVIDRNGVKKYYSAWDVLRNILIAFGARLILSNGRFYVYQPQRQDDTTVGVHLHQTDQAKTSGTLANWDNSTTASDLNKITGGVYKFYPPLQQVLIHYTHFSTRNLIADVDLNSEVASVVDIDSASGTARIQFSFIMNFKTNFTTPSELVPNVHKYRLQIQVGTYYLNRTGTYNGTGGIDYSDLTWETSPSFYEFYSRVNYTNDYWWWHPYGEITPPIPADGDLTITFQFVNVRDTYGNTIPFLFTEDYEMVNVNFNTWQEGTLEGRTNVRTYVTNNNTSSANSLTLSANTIIGDGPSGNAFGALQVTPDGGSTWNVADQWDEGTGASPVPLGQLLANKIMAGQANPVRRMLSEFDGDYRAHYTLIKGSDNYVFGGGSFTAGFDRWDGEWWLLSTSDADATAGTTQDVYDILIVQEDTRISGGGTVIVPPESTTGGSSDTGGGTGHDSSSGGGTGSGPGSLSLETFVEEFTSVSSSSITVTVNSGDLPNNTAQIQVFMNGLKLREDATNGYTVNGSDIEFNGFTPSGAYFEVWFMIMQ